MSLSLANGNHNLMGRYIAQLFVTSICCFDHIGLNS